MPLPDVSLLLSFGMKNASVLSNFKKEILPNSLNLSAESNTGFPVKILHVYIMTVA